MAAVITAAARTPWAPRHGALEGARPEELLSAALTGLFGAGKLPPDDVALLLVACDTGVGAQDLNLGRRTAVGLGWQHLPALTVDGQGVADLGLLQLAVGMATAGAPRPGRVVVAAMDCTSMVPPGAGLVRDYGRPALVTPRQQRLDEWARCAGITRDDLDRQTRELLASRGDTGPHPGVVPVSIAGRRQVSALAEDVGVVIDADWAELEPLNGPGGIITAFHEAPLADGACAVVIGGEEVAAGARRVSATLTATDDVTGRLSSMASPLVLADPSVVPHRLLGGAVHDVIPSVRAVGSTPSANGLRCLVDAFHTTQDEVTIVEIGADGQLACAELASASRGGPSSNRSADP